MDASHAYLRLISSRDLSPADLDLLFPTLVFGFAPAANKQCLRASGSAAPSAAATAGFPPSSATTTGDEGWWTDDAPASSGGEGDDYGGGGGGGAGGVGGGGGAWWPPALSLSPCDARLAGTPNGPPPPSSSSSSPSSWSCGGKNGSEGVPLVRVPLRPSRYMMLNSPEPSSQAPGGGVGGRDWVMFLGPLGGAVGGQGVGSGVPDVVGVLGNSFLSGVWLQADPVCGGVALGLVRSCADLRF